MTKSKFCVGIDLGGTNIAVGIVDLEEKSIVAKGSVKTKAPRSCEEITTDAVELIKSLCQSQGISLESLAWIGAAAPGIVKNGVVVAAANLGWTNAPFGELVEKMTGVHTYVANDANVAAFAEAVWGSGCGSESLVAFTIGTGVGGGIVFNGKIWEGTNGFAAEMGHMVIDRNGRKCACGKVGCLETYCSATALVRDTKRKMEHSPKSLMWRIVGGDLERVNGKTAFSAAASGDAAAKDVVDNFISHLAIGVSNAINIFQPDVVCIGGGISREGDVLMNPLREKVEATSFGLEGHRTRVVAASFCNDAGIIGAALLGLQKKTKDE